MKIKYLFFFFLLSFTIPPITGKVIAISDGDTIKVLVNNTQIKVRLNGIDCPEKDQDFGQKAKQFTSELCFGKEVKVISHGEDRYGRTLGDIILPDGRILNQELVKAGLAWHYKQYSNDTILSNLEIQARQQKTGLWLQSNAIAPWDFRKGKREEDDNTRIDNAIKQGKLSPFTFQINSKESPCIETLWVDSDNIQKVEKGCGDGSLEMAKEHYYLKDNELYLFKTEYHIFNAPPTYTKERAIKDGVTSGWFDSAKSIIKTTHYYFEKNKLIRVVGDEKIRINTTEDYQKKEKQIIVSLNTSLANYKKEKK